VYQVSSSNKAHLSLLPFALSTASNNLPRNSDNHASGSRLSTNEGGARVGVNDQTETVSRPSIGALRDSLFLITLDWESPWTFLTQLIEWLDVIREVVEDSVEISKGSWSKERATWDEMKETLEKYIREYTDPSGPTGAAVSTEDEEVGNTSTASAIVAVSNPVALGDDEAAPLPEGCLAHNFGLPIVVVCTKSDRITQLEKERNFKEEQFDYIQQVLRTVCLKCECTPAHEIKSETSLTSLILQ
jgi:dynein light intermediate chain 1